MSTRAGIGHPIRQTTSFHRVWLAVASSATLAIVGAGLSGCLPPGVIAKKVLVVTTNNIVADWVSNIGGDRVSVYALLPIGADPHTYQPGAGDVARAAEAKLVFAVGLGLERTWLTRLINNASGQSTKVVSLGDYVDPLPVGPGGESEGLFDPHFWWDPLRVRQAITEVVARLSAVDPDGADLYRTNGRAYDAQIQELDNRIISVTQEIPEDRRKIVTSHETMQYFARRYGFEAVGSVFPGIGTDREPSAAELARLAADMRTLGVGVIFTEPIVTDRLAKSIAAETGAKVVRLYSDSLGPSRSGAGTYISMMNTNVNLISQALK